METNNCWNWYGEIKESGYGRVTIKGKKYAVHRKIYELLVGEIPEDMEIDHLCRNRKCVNPKHLEPVTHAENVRRAQPFIKLKTHCKRGHEFTKENTFFLVRTNGKANRVCKTCKAQSQSKYMKSL